MCFTDLHFTNDMLGFRMYSPGRGRGMAMWAVAAMAGSARQPPILGWASWNAYQCDRSQLTEANIRTVSVGWQNFGKMLLVFGCIGTDFCK